MKTTKTKQNRCADISDLVVVLCNMLESWSKHPDSFSIGDIDKAVAALKKLQEIKAAEQNSVEQTNTIVVSHCIPRPEETEGAEKT